jgi:hypothetical protein
LSVAAFAPTFTVGVKEHRGVCSAAPGRHLPTPGFGVSDDRCSRAGRCAALTCANPVHGPLMVEPIGGTHQFELPSVCSPINDRRPSIFAICGLWVSSLSRSRLGATACPPCVSVDELELPETTNDVPRRGGRSASTPLVMPARARIATVIICMTVAPFPLQIGSARCRGDGRVGGEEPARRGEHPRAGRAQHRLVHRGADRHLQLGGEPTPARPARVEIIWHTATASARTQALVLIATTAHLFTPYCHCSQLPRRTATNVTTASVMVVRPRSACRHRPPDRLTLRPARWRPRGEGR